MTTTASLSRGWHPLAKDALLAAWLVLAGNLPFWLTVWHLPEMRAHPWLMAGLGGLLMALSTASLGLFMWSPWRRALGVLLLALAGSGSYFMWAYGIVIDPGMVSNVLHTDSIEAAGLFSWPLVVALALGVLLPAVWWWRTPVRPVAWRTQAWQRAAAVVGSALVLTVLCLALFQDLASLMRNHKSLRYMLNPYNSVYALLRQGATESAQATQALRPMGTDAHRVTTATASSQAPLLVLVVGETARAANFGVGGYARNTTPNLSALAASGALTYFSQVQSCGTSTQVSVPCMFSRLGRAGLDAPREENLLDMLHRAGLSVTWIDNQSGCKGVCDRVDHLRAIDRMDKAACTGEGCPDAVLPGMALQVEAASDRTRPEVIVLHQMGNHGPAYYQRSLKAHKVFLPECETNTLSACDAQAIVNAYDNAIVETDAMLGELIQRLSALQRPSAVLYLSDHGESLGEGGLFLHGMPWSLAPETQKHVPMALWLSPDLQAQQKLDSACLSAQAVRPWSHDNLFHTVAELMRVESRDIDPQRDILAPCRHGESIWRTAHAMH